MCGNHFYGELTENHVRGMNTQFQILEVGSVYFKKRTSGY